MRIQKVISAKKLPQFQTVLLKIEALSKYKGKQGTSPWFSVECYKTKTKPITYQLDFSANLKP